jgi:hypothetical protein
MAKKARSEMRAKANKMANAKSPTKVDASSWSPSEPLHADKKTGARPLRARIYKAGGRVQGDRGPVNAGKEPRANGGALSMTNVPDENKKAKGSFHEGGYKGGGRAEKCGGGSMNKGGRAEKAKGGKADKKPVVDPLMQIRTKRVEYLPPREGAMEKYEASKRAREKSDDPPMRPAGVTLHSKGGKADDKKQDKAEIKTAIHKHDKQMHEGKLTKGLKKGGGADSAGGRVERANGGASERMVPLSDKQREIAATVKDATRPKDADQKTLREKRAKGGRTKGKTNINIIIGSPGGGQQPNTPPPQAPVRPPPPPPQAMPPGPPPGMGGPPPGPPPGGPPMGPPPGGPPDMPPGMPRARGGRTGYMSKDAGAGSALGRLRKVHKEGQHTPGFRS